MGHLEIALRPACDHDRAGRHPGIDRLMRLARDKRKSGSLRVSRSFICFTFLPGRIEYQLRTSKQGDRFPAGFICHFGIPYLGRPSTVGVGSN